MSGVKNLISEMRRWRLQLYLSWALLLLCGGGLLHIKNLLRGLPMRIGSGLVEKPSILFLLSRIRADHMAADQSSF